MKAMKLLKFIRLSVILLCSSHCMAYQVCRLSVHSHKLPRNNDMEVT